MSEAWIAALSALGSVLVFDFPLKGGSYPERVTELEKITSILGEPMQGGFSYAEISRALYALGFNTFPESSIKGVKDGMATVTMETGLDTVIPCDAIVNAADMLPDTSLLDGISVKETYAIGDCANPFNIALAIRGGNDAGRKV